MRARYRADNLFSGLLYDLSLTDDSPARPMHFQKVQRGTYLTSAFSKTEKQNRIRYDVVEYAALGFLADEDWNSIAGQTESEECTQARADLDTALREIDVIERRITVNTTAMDAEDIDVDTVKFLASKVTKDTAALATLQDRRDVLQSNVDRACRRCETLYQPETMLALIAQNTPEATEVRLKLRALIRQAVRRIDIVFNVPGAKSPDAVALIMTYVNGVSHGAVFGRTGSAPIFIGDLGNVVGAAL